MKKTKSWQQQLSKAALPLVLLSAFFSVHAEARTDRLIIEEGDSSLTKEQARQQKEVWDETHRLRSKKIRRAEKDFDKSDRNADTRDTCEQNLNINAYWEPNTSRCLDRRTGRPVMP